MANPDKPKNRRTGADELSRRIFISCATSDKPVALKIAERLRQSGLGVWFDVWELQAGDSLREKVREAVAGIDYILVVLSPRAVANRRKNQHYGSGI